MKRKEIKEAIIWRKSVYDNHFKCQLCGAKLANEQTGEPTDNVGLSNEVMEKGFDADNRLFCNACWKKGKLNVVATIKCIPASSDEIGLMGYWGDRTKQYEKEFEKAEQYVKQLKEMTKTLNKKLSEISEMESTITVLENRCKNKDAEIKKYSAKLQELTKENEQLRHRVEELTEVIRGMA